MAIEQVKLANEQQTMYALVELMGHQRMVGRITEITIAGKGFLQIDVLDGDGNIRFSRPVNPDSIYAINPLNYEACIAVTMQMQQQPMVPYSITPEHLQLLRGGTIGDDLIDDDNYDDDDDYNDHHQVESDLNPEGAA